MENKSWMRAQETACIHYRLNVFIPYYKKTCIWSVSVTQITPQWEMKWVLGFQVFLWPNNNNKKNTNNKFPSICFWNSDAEGKRTPASVKEPIKCPGQQEVNIAAALSRASSALWGWSRCRSRWRRGTGSCCRSLRCLSRGTARRSLDADRQTPWSSLPAGDTRGTRVRAGQQHLMLLTWFRRFCWEQPEV